MSAITVDATEQVRAVTSSIPNHGEPEPQRCLLKLKHVALHKRQCGDELHDKYRVTTDDMKPEYMVHREGYALPPARGLCAL